MLSLSRGGAQALQQGEHGLAFGQVGICAHLDHGKKQLEDRG
jgi:hypothetical protein